MASEILVITIILAWVCVWRISMPKSSPHTNFSSSDGGSCKSRITRQKSSAFIAFTAASQELANVSLNGVLKLY